MLEKGIGGNNMSFEELRAEFTKASFRKKLKKELGTTCVNCGNSENIEYHHIVPLINGGTNNISNIVPLCKECHYKAHDKEYKHGNKKGNKGRKRKVTYEEALPVLDKYFNLEIGLKEAKEILGLAPGNNSSWYTLANRYKDEHNVSRYFRNNIDILNSQEKRLSTRAYNS